MSDKKCCGGFSSTHRVQYFTPHAKPFNQITDDRLTYLEAKVLSLEKENEPKSLEDAVESVKGVIKSVKGVIKSIADTLRDTQTYAVKNGWDMRAHGAIDAVIDSLKVIVGGKP